MMATKGTKTKQSDDILVVCLAAFTHGYRVVKAGQRLAATDALVVANPKRFVSEHMPDAEREAIANRMLFAARPERELTNAEQKRDEELFRRRRERRTPRLTVWIRHLLRSERHGPSVLRACAAVSLSCDPY
jgi:hypothetical protein